MIQSKLIEKISESYPLLKNDMARCVKIIENAMINHLSNFGRIEIRDFGSFDLCYHRPRLARNPKTGIKLVTEPKYIVHFKPGKALKERINASRHSPI